MRIKLILLPALLLMLSVFGPDAYGQRWYDEQRDLKAREAAKLAEEITSKSSFEAQARNLDKFAERDFEVYFKGAERQMELDINALRKWKNVQALVDKTKRSLGSSTLFSADAVRDIVEDLKRECQLRTSPLGKSVCEAREELDKLKEVTAQADKTAKALDKELKTRLETIDAIQSLVDQTQAFLVSDADKGKTLSELSEAFAGLATSFFTFRNTLQKIHNDPLDDLLLLRQRVAVETLQLEVDHWKTLNEINIRRNAEETDVNNVVRDVEARLSQMSKCFRVLPESLATQDIRDTFTTALALKSCQMDNVEQPGQQMTIETPDIVAYVLQTLNGAAALAARGSTPKTLAELREAHELHRFSIRKSLVVARGYELAIRTGTNRLSRYYAGGLKPQQIAQLITSAATLAIPGVIAGN
jgi:hypothetical protein